MTGLRERIVQALRLRMLLGSSQEEREPVAGSVDAVDFEQSDAYGRSTKCHGNFLSA